MPPGRMEIFAKRLSMSLAIIALRFDRFRQFDCGAGQYGELSPR